MLSVYKRKDRSDNSEKEPYFLDFKEIQPVHSEGDQPWDFFGGMMLKLTLQYFGHLMRRVDSLEKTDAGRVWGQ